MATFVAIGIQKHTSLANFSDMEAYFPILNALHEAKVEFAIIGTWALKLYFPFKMADYELNDCDLVMDPSIKNIRKAIKVLKADEWQVKVWEDEVTEIVKWAELKGKYYLRATKDALRLDLTYENNLVPWPVMVGTIQWRCELPLAHLINVKFLKEMKGSPKDLETLELLFDQEY